MAEWLFWQPATNNVHEYIMSYPLWKICIVRSFNIVLLYELTIYSYNLYLVLTVELEAIRQKLYSLDVSISCCGCCRKWSAVYVGNL